MPNALVVQSSIAGSMRAASAVLGRIFAWIGGTAIGLVLGLGRLARAIIGEIAMQFLMVALWFRWAVKFAAWACILSAALLQYQVPGTEGQNLLMFGVGLVAMIVARGMTVLEYRISQHRFLIMARFDHPAVWFRRGLDEPFI
ncbi:hypothetical protein AruPA_20960 [Acidiphilium sp. PA]|uniref:hypothetical protein n=1 Tax=Acidiphilium sp. PA TaxID=2871705 RepID=UPI00224322C3|nr:hypothetical protein [Acidiphilium sp. PA]MCW8309489.1 hypothetical protein [Acidiphilium sp. PA]